METNLTGGDVASFLTACVCFAEGRMKRMEDRLAFIKGEIKAFSDMREKVLSNISMSEEQCKGLALTFWEQAESSCKNLSLKDFFANGSANAATYLLDFLDLSNFVKEKIPEWELVLRVRGEILAEKKDCK